MRGRVSASAAISITLCLLLALAAIKVCVGWPRSWPVATAKASESEPDYDVDAVLTWVDASDEAWQAAKRAKSGRAADVEDGAERYTAPEHPDAELELSLELLLENAPWIRRMHVITARPQRPRCLDANPVLRSARHKIVVVHHDQIFKGKEARAALPVFNSHAIESCLHNVPGLAERFVYLNDDMFVLRPVVREQWFNQGRPRLLPSVYQPLRDRAFNAFMPSAHQKAWNNMADLLDHNPVYLCPHQPYPLTRSVLRKALDDEETTPIEVRRTRTSAFRSDDDVPPVGYALNAGLASGEVALAEVGVHDVQGMHKGDALREDPLPQFVCINTSHDIASETSRVRRLARS